MDKSFSVKSHGESVEIIKGLEMEAEQLGMVALIGLILAPGAYWTVQGPTVARKALRASLVAGLLAGAVAFEVAMDKTVDTVADAVTD